MNISQVLNMSDGIEKAKELAIRGLVNREMHHKQWYIEEVLKALGTDLDELYQELTDSGDIDEDARGIAP